MLGGTIIYGDSIRSNLPHQTCRVYDEHNGYVHMFKFHDIRPSRGPCELVVKFSTYSTASSCTHYHIRFRVIMSQAPRNSNSYVRSTGREKRALDRQAKSDSRKIHTAAAVAGLRNHTDGLIQKNSNNNSHNNNSIYLQERHFLKRLEQLQRKSLLAKSGHHRLRQKSAR